MGILTVDEVVEKVQRSYPKMDMRARLSSTNLDLVPDDVYLYLETRDYLHTPEDIFLYLQHPDKPLDYYEFAEFWYGLSLMERMQFREMPLD